MIFLRDFVVSPVLGDFAFFAVSRHFPYLGTLNDLYGKLRQGGSQIRKASGCSISSATLLWIYLPVDQMTPKQYWASVGPGSVWPQILNNNVSMVSQGPFGSVFRDLHMSPSGLIPFCRKGSRNRRAVMHKRPFRCLDSSQTSSQSSEMR